MTDVTQRFSRLVAGAMTWGSWGKKYNSRQMQDLMEHCLQAGITTFDHADIYGDYSTEADFGKAFAGSGIRRERIQLVSKCGIQMLGDARPNRVKHYNYSRDYIVESVERSLKMLQTEYLDLFLLHRPSPLMEPEVIAAAVDHLRQRGMIRAFGLSNFNPSQVHLIDKVVPVEANQVECSLTNPFVMFDGTLDDCITNNRMAMAWSPLGSYFRDDEGSYSALQKQLKKMEAKYDASATQVLLAWLLKHPAKIHPVLGTTRKERITEACAALDLELDLEDWFLLLEASTGKQVP